MSYATVLTRASLGIEAPLVHVEAHVTGGLPVFNIVGMPETAVREARDRARGALQNSGYNHPDQRITINLAPADLPKSGGRYDLAIAIALLCASGQLPTHHLGRIEVLGELSLSGAIRPVRGVLSAARAAARVQRALLVPTRNAGEAALADGVLALGCNHLGDACRLLAAPELPPYGAEPMPIRNAPPGLPLEDVRGQAVARRALVIAAAGAHNLLMTGPPGTGKTMLARRLPSLLPTLEGDEHLDVLTIASLAGNLAQADNRRPFRDPHHTASAVALVGGGAAPVPGEITLAHGGVLFLDEIAEFPRYVLEVLREPLETGEIAIARATARVRFPARFQLVAAMNPCPAGRACVEPCGPGCSCSPDQLRRYRARLSAPLLDRIDLHVEVPRIPAIELQKPPDGEGTQALRERVARARTRATTRSGQPNAWLPVEAIDRVCALTPELRDELVAIAERLGLSARALHRVLKVARTIADLEGNDPISRGHLFEALAYRPQPVADDR